MTQQQFLILLGTVYIAPHMNSTVALIIGALIIVFAFKFDGV